MPHQCVHCSKMYPDAAEELLKGCVCGSHFFYYIKKEYADRLQQEAVEQKIEELNTVDKVQIEKDVREIMGIEEEEIVPVVLDLESIKVLEPGKYEIDVVNLFSKKRPLIYKLEEGKYVIDLASSIKVNSEELDRNSRELD